ncbi:hypothetical protein WMY93_006951 [Mugilogobius chulae]|uniref:Bcl-2 Bcl-2 homology region 1-3 domain-containing protein n=1 Tax=Mugilogobius chulae TaxID=88201 RepID=A0AAW0PQ07_9GOBI
MKVVPADLSCTETLQTWHRPWTQGIRPEPVTEMTVSEPKLKGKRIMGGVKSTLVIRGEVGQLPDEVPLHAEELDAQEQQVVIQLATRIRTMGQNLADSQELQRYLALPCLGLGVARHWRGQVTWGVRSCPRNSIYQQCYRRDGKFARLCLANVSIPDGKGISNRNFVGKDIAPVLCSRTAGGKDGEGATPSLSCPHRVIQGQLRGLSDEVPPLPNQLHEQEQRVVEELVRNLQIFGQNLADSQQRAIDNTANLPGSAWPTFRFLTARIFQEGISWERISLLFYVAGRVAARMVKARLPHLVVHILQWTVEFFLCHLLNWVLRHGGWSRGRVVYISTSIMAPLPVFGRICDVRENASDGRNERRLHASSFSATGPMLWTGAKMATGGTQRVHG